MSTVFSFSVFHEGSISEGHHEGIIDKETFELANAALRQRGREKGNVPMENRQLRNNPHNNRYAFSGRLKCGCCGGTMQRITQKLRDGKQYHWGCMVHIEDKEKCWMKREYEDTIQNAFMTMLNKLVYGQDVIIDTYLTALRNEHSLKNREKIKELEDRLEQISSEKRRLSILIAKGCEPVSFRVKTLELDAEANNIRAELMQLQDDPAQVKAALALRDHLTVWKKRLTDDFPAQLFSRIVDHAVVRTSVEIEFHLKCGLVLTVNSMLQNEKFMGDLLLQKSYVADFLTKRREKNDGVFPQYYVENAHDPVVPKEVFYRVQGEFERRREGSTINDRKYALSGKIYCADCGEKYSRCAGTEKYPDAVWRCRKKGCGRTVKEDDLKKAVIAAFNRTPERREELIRMQERLQWGQMDRISEEIAAVDERKAELENAISDYASGGTLDSRMVFLYGDGTEDVEAAIEGIRNEMENLACMKMELLTQKGELAMREAQIHSLFRLTEAIEKRNSPSDPEEEAAKPDPSCTTLEDFYRRTDDIDVKGRIRKYDKRLVRRFIERVDVKPESLVICFKAGVSVEVAG